MVVWSITRTVSNDNHTYVYARFWNAHQEGQDIVIDSLLVEEESFKMGGRNHINYNSIRNRLNAEARKKE